MSEQEEPKLVKSGDEWAEYTYKGRRLFDTSCGNAGVYENGIWQTRTIQEYLEKDRTRKSD